MDRSVRPRRRLLGGLMIAAPAWGAGLLGAGCASPSAIPPPAGGEPMPMPTLAVGDRWRYRLLNRYNGGLIGEVAVDVVATAPEIRLRMDPGDGRPALEERWADPWTVIVDAGWDAPMRFETPMPVVPAGARTGLVASASTRYASDRASGRLLWRQRQRVVGWERVQVPAGTFDALRIDRSIAYEHPDFFRFGAERDESIWVAPGTGHWVAREWTGSFMPGSPTPRAGRARDDWIRWELVAAARAGRRDA